VRVGSGGREQAAVIGVEERYPSHRQLLSAFDAHSAAVPPRRGLGRVDIDADVVPVLPDARLVEAQAAAAQRPFRDEHVRALHLDVVAGLQVQRVGEVGRGVELRVGDVAVRVDLEYVDGSARLIVVVRRVLCEISAKVVDVQLAHLEVGSLEARDVGVGRAHGGRDLLPQAHAAVHVLGDQSDLLELEVHHLVGVVPPRDLVLGAQGLVGQRELGAPLREGEHRLDLLLHEARPGERPARVRRGDVDQDFAIHGGIDDHARVGFVVVVDALPVPRVPSHGRRVRAPVHQCHDGVCAALHIHVALLVGERELGRQDRLARCDQLGRVALRQGQLGLIARALDTLHNELRRSPRSKDLNVAVVGAQARIRHADLDLKDFRLHPVTRGNGTLLTGKAEGLILSYARRGKFQPGREVDKVDLAPNCVL